MESNQEQNLNTEQNAEQTPVNTEATATTEQNIQEQTQQPTEEEIALRILRSKGHEINSFDDLRKELEVKIVEKEVNPYADVLDDDTKRYLDFRRETGRDRKDFEALQQDLDKVDPIVWAREKVKRESGQDLPNNIIDEFLEEELGITLEDLDARGQIKLAQYGRDIKEAKKAEQEKYRKPVEDKSPAQASQQQEPEILQLDNGSFMKKADYEAMVNTRQKFIEEATEAGNRVVASTFKVNFDDNGTQKELNYSYEFTEDDRRSAVSGATNVNAVMDSYRTEKGFNHEQFQEDMFWLNKQNREKAMASIVNKARAEAMEEVLKQRGNVNFDSTLPLQTTKKDGVTYMSPGQLFN